MHRDAELPFLTGGGEMGERTRAMDWSSTRVGPPGAWPQSLKTAVSICLGSRYPIVIWWGRPAYTMFYNDAYISFLGVTKHPGWLGRSGRECWSDIWPVIGPMLEGVFATGQATWSEDLLLVLDRNVPREEAYFTFSYSPIPDDGGAIGGIFCACCETTDRVIGARRLRTLRDLGKLGVEAKAVERACEIAARTLAENPNDIPFALIYLLEEDSTHARLVAASGLEEGSAAGPSRIDLSDWSQSLSTWPLQRVLDSGKPELVTEVSSKFGRLPGGAWPESPEVASIVPIAGAGQAAPAGFLVCGLSPRRIVDADYRAFVELVAGHIGTAIANARAYDEERKRAQALAEIDRAKTAFFSNVSHEFRTPLTLMMGPLEDALSQGSLSAADRERLEVAHRNSLRLLKLVNTLLDFSRIESGRIQASYEPVDLAALTADLASVFRSAIERAGMELIVDCDALSQPVYVDRDMWEKIVLNLLSNAFKFTLEGRIEVMLRQLDGSAQLSVIDTGTGIEPDEVPRVFERFHRAKGARGRSYEGSGIGLALVQELVKLHGGSVSLESKLNDGSRFTVTIPLGKAHLPAERVEVSRTADSKGSLAHAYVQELLSWGASLGGNEAPIRELSEEIIGGAGAFVPDTTSRTGPAGRLLLVDDNVDMRDYLRRLFARRGYHLEIAADGIAALRAAREYKPDLVVTDVMMPGLDGFGLLHAIRSDAQLRDTPVLLLSARAGEEARIEGMQAGADDYLVKPFSARELLARVESQLNLARFRRATHSIAESEQSVRRLAAIVESSDDAIVSTDLDWTILSWNRGAAKLFGYTSEEMVGRSAAVLVPAQRRHEGVEILRRIRRGEHFEHYETEARCKDGRLIDVSLTVSPMRDAAGRVIGASQIARDISQRKQADETRQLLVGELNHRIKNTLATVQAMVQQTLRSCGDPADFAARISGRIQSLARVHSLLTEAVWQGAGLRELLRDQLIQGTVDETKLKIKGPVVVLGAQQALHVALMLHELGTNSIKYGALSSPRGTVTISWRAKEDMLQIHWVERDGPAVVAPAQRGFGTTLIEQSARSEGGTAQALWEAEGITWEIALPLPTPPAMAAHYDLPPARSGGGLQRADEAAVAKVLTGRRLLIVEDEPLIALDLGSNLVRAGAVVATSVGTHTEALTAVEEESFDAALLDGNLHGQPVDQIAAMLTRRNIPFVFVTGYTDANLPRAFGHVTVLNKPFSAQQVIDAVLGLVSRPNGVRQLRVGAPTEQG